MSTFNLDAYKDWSVDKLKKRCRELCRVSMHKDVLIAVLWKYGIDELSPADRMEVDRICSQWED